MTPKDPTHRPTPAHVQETITDYWDLRAPIYDAHQQRPERVDLDRAAWTEIWTRILPPPPAAVLDLGTGSGHVALVLAHLGYRVTGADLSAGMLRQAAGHAAQMTNAPQFVLADAVRPGFADESFQVITNRYLMWTLREPRRALLNWRRLLRPGGLLAVVDAPWFPRGLQANRTEGFADHYDRNVRRALPLAEARSIEETADCIRQAGFHDVAVEPLTTIHELDRRTGTAPGHDVQMQYLITARR